MSESKKYYYIRLKEDFFDSPEIKVLEAAANGYKYSNLLLKLYLKSLRFEGRLRLNECIPYNEEMIAAVTNMDIDTVRVALKLFKDLKLIEILDNGTIYMTDIQNFIGKSTTEADRKRNYRAKIEAEKENICLPESEENGQMSDKTPPEIENRDRDRDRDRDRYISDSKETLSNNDVELIITKWNELGLQKLSSINKGSKRRTSAKARIKEVGLEEFIKAIESIKESSFLRGQNSRNWIITFDWMIKPNNFIKVLEGNYLDKGVNNKNGGYNNIRGNNKSYKGVSIPENKTELTPEQQAAAAELI